MKNTIRQIFLLAVSVLVLSSCSQTKQLADTNSPAPVRYNKVYVGNKIIYRNHQQKDAEVQLEIDEESLAYMEADPEVVVPLEDQIPNNEKIAQDLTADAGQPSPRINEDLRELSKRLAKKIYGLSSDAEEPQKTQDEETLALLGFIFTLAGILFSFLPIAFLGFIGFLLVVAGFVLSILGLDSHRRVLAIIGLVLSSIYLLLILIALIFIGSMMAAMF